MYSVVNVLVDRLFDLLADQLEDEGRELLILYLWLVLILYDPETVPDCDQLEAICQAVNALRQ